MTNLDAGSTSRVGVSLGDRRISFPDSAPAPVLSDTVLLGLRFTAQFEGGRSYTVDLSDYQFPGLAKDAMRVLWSESQPLGSYRSPGTLEHAKTVLRAFAAFAGEVGLGHRMTGLAALTATDMTEFEKWMRAKHGQGSHTPYQRMSAFRQFLLRAHHHGLVSPGLLSRLSYVADGPINLKAKGKRDAYSAFVAGQIREAAWKDIHAAVERITVEGPRVAAAGRDPLESDCRSDENVAWAAANLGLTAPSNHKIGSPGWNYAHYRRHRDKSGERSHADIMALFFPTMADIFALSSLISLEAGLPIESVRELKSDCLRNEARGYADLYYVKRRRGSITETKKRVKVDGTRSPGAAVKIALTLTQTARRFAPEDEAQWLFIGWGGQSVNAEGLRRLVPKASPVQDFCARHGILDDKGERLQRFALANLRKTFKASQYKKANGHLADAADDHSKAVHANNYAAIPSLAELHESTVAEGLEQALASALSPLLLPEVDEARVRTDPTGLAADTGLDMKSIKLLGDGDGDVWFASCLGFDKSPYANPGDKGCPCPVWGCLSCKNAVITSSKLPAIIAFLNHILQRRQEMDLRAWTARFAVAYRHITVDILPRFPEREVTLAHAVAASEGDLVWLPAELTMTR